MGLESKITSRYGAAPVDKVTSAGIQRFLQTGDFLAPIDRLDDPRVEKDAECSDYFQQTYEWALEQKALGDRSVMPFIEAYESGIHPEQLQMALCEIFDIVLPREADKRNKSDGLTKQQLANRERIIEEGIAWAKEAGESRASVFTENHGGTTSGGNGKNYGQIRPSPSRKSSGSRR